jgi:hypothetical protein
VPKNMSIWCDGGSRRRIRQVMARFGMLRFLKNLAMPKRPSKTPQLEPVELCEAWEQDRCT